jgi:hypothetical protein
VDTYVHGKGQHTANVEESMKKYLSCSHRTLRSIIKLHQLHPHHSKLQNSQFKKDPNFLYQHAPNDTQILLDIGRNPIFARAGGVDLLQGREGLWWVWHVEWLTRGSEGDPMRKF